MELLEVEKEVICGKKITVFTIHGDDGPEKYLIGVQVSKILRRQTFNLYRSLKLKGVGVIRATPQQVGFLLRTQSLPPNSHSVSLIPYKGAKDFILENFKGKIDEPAPTASKSAQPRSAVPTTTAPPALSTPQPTQQQAAQLQKILQLQQLKRAYEREYSAYSSGNESSSSSFSNSAALSSDSEADHYYQRRRPAPPLPTYHSPVLPTDELKRHQRPSMMANAILQQQQQQYQQYQQYQQQYQNASSVSPKRGSSPPELEAGEVLASFFRRTQQQQPLPHIPSPSGFAPPPLPTPQQLTLPPISALPSAVSPLPSVPVATTTTTTTIQPQPQPLRNPKHDLSFLLG